MDSWIRDVSRGDFVGALLIELSKAFDSVSHPQLINDLMDIGCSQSTLQWFGSFLCHRQQRVKSGSNITDWKLVTRGVPQGSPLSPLLFNILVRHLPEASGSDAYQFADDLTNSAADSNPDILASKLTDTYGKVKAYCLKRNLKINLTKTQLIIFKTPRKQLPTDYSISLDNVVLTPCNTVTLLGITLDQHFTMAPHISGVVKKCNGLLGVLRRAATCLPIELLNTVYMTLIRSQLEFASACFSTAANTHLLKLDTIQKIASRIITGSPRCAHSAPLQAKLGLETLQSRRNKHISKLVDAILAGQSHPYFKNFFSTERNGDRLPTTNNKLNNKRFSRFGVQFIKE